MAKPLRLPDLIDVEMLQQLQDRLNRVYAFPSAIIENDGTVLTATNWQDVCVKFHRVHPECRLECVKSDQYILEHLKDANPAVTYECPHGLVDNATPILIDGRHVANYFTGQFFLEPPDLEHFRAQARRYGFDEEAYLEAVRKVPVWSREKLGQYLQFIRGFVQLISVLGERALSLRAGEDRYRSLFEHSGDYILVLEASPEGPPVIRDCNAATVEKHGFTREELLGRPVVFLDSADTTEEAQRARAAALRARDSALFEVRHRRKDGTTFLAEASVRRLELEGRTFFLSIERDITERKRLETSLRENERRLRSAVRVAGIGTYSYDFARGELYVSPELKAILGLGPAPAPAPGSELILGEAHADDRAAVLAAMRRANAPGSDGNLELEYRIRVPDGDVRWVRVHGRTEFTGTGEERRPAHAYGAVLDVTAAKRAEESLRNVQKLESLGTLAGGIAHDFNNMLTGIVASLSLLKADLEQGDGRLEVVAEAEEACQAARGLARQLLTFAAGGEPVTSVEDIGRLVRHAVEFSSRGSNVRCAFDLEPDRLLAAVDRDQIFQVVQNLVINAIHAMPAGGTLHVAGAAVTLAEDAVPGLPAGRYVRVSVRDEGAGIPSDTLHRVFDPFFSTKGTSRGLGLAVSHSIVVRHRGRLHVTSSPGQGATFTVHLPAADHAPARPAPAERARADLRGRRVLVMDDDEGVVKAVRRLLDRLGCQAESVPDGESALAAWGAAAASGNPFDAGIMDLTIAGGLGGRETMARLRELDPAARVLVSSGYSNDPVMAEYRRYGFSGMLVKPYRLEDLSAALSMALGALR